MSHCPPPEALITSCIPGCDSQVMWEYEPGEPQTYWHPGEPDYFTPVKGCTLDHLEQTVNDSVYESRIGELYRQLEQWELLADAAWRNEHNSRRYLGALRRLRSIRWEDL